VHAEILGGFRGEARPTNVIPKAVKRAVTEKKDTKGVPWKREKKKKTKPFPPGWWDAGVGAARKKPMCGEGSKGQHREREEARQKNAQEFQPTGYRERQKNGKRNGFRRLTGGGAKKKKSLLHWKTKSSLTFMRTGLGKENSTPKTRAYSSW